MQVITRDEGIELVRTTKKYTEEYRLLEDGMALVFDEYPTRFLTSCYQRYIGRFHCKKHLQPDKKTFVWVCFIDDKQTATQAPVDQVSQLQGAANQHNALAAA